MVRILYTYTSYLTYLRRLYLLFLLGAGEDVVLSVELSIVSNALLALLLLSFSSGADLYYIYAIRFILIIIRAYVPFLLINRRVDLKS
jgi:hypothetical protein